MAVDTLRRTVLVDDDLLFCNLLGLCMAFRALNARVTSGQGQMRFVMVKCRWSPPLGLVAVLTARLAVLGNELPVVSVFVTGFALHQSALEPLVGIGGRLVALPARNRAMGA